jgi:hypothetical protein
VAGAGAKDGAVVADAGEEFQGPGVFDARRLCEPADAGDLRFFGDGHGGNQYIRMGRHIRMVSGCARSTVPAIPLLAKDARNGAPYFFRYSMSLFHPLRARGITKENFGNRG